MSGDEHKPAKKLETERGGSGRKGKTAIGTTGSGFGGEVPSTGKWPPQDAPPRFRPRTVICEKDDTIRLGFRIMLKKVALVVGEAKDGKDACEIITALRPELVLMDMDLEIQNGLSVLHSLQNGVLKSVAVLITTDVYYATKYFHQLCRYGASGFYRKSTGKADLVRSVNELIDGGTPVDPMIKELIEQGSRVPRKHELTETEIEVLVRLDLRNKEIAEELGVSLRSVDHTVTSITNKLRAKTRTGAALKAVDMGYKLLPIMPSRDPETGNSHEYLRALQHALGEIASSQSDG